VEKLEALDGGRQSANSGPSDHASTEDDFFARFPVSGHWIDGTYFSRLIGSKSVTGHS
jgi:hypothetical protein